MTSNMLSIWPIITFHKWTPAYACYALRYVAYAPTDTANLSWPTKVKKKIPVRFYDGTTEWPFFRCSFLPRKTTLVRTTDDPLHAIVGMAYCQLSAFADWHWRAVNVWLLQSSEHNVNKLGRIDG